MAAKYKIGDVAVTTYNMGVITSVEKKVVRKYDNTTGIYTDIQETHYGLNGYNAPPVQQYASGSGDMGGGGLYHAPNQIYHQNVQSVKEEDIKRIL